MYHTAHTTFSPCFAPQSPVLTHLKWCWPLPGWLDSPLERKLQEVRSYVCVISVDLLMPGTQEDLF